MIGAVQNHPPVTDPAAARALRNRDRDRRPVHIRPDERAGLHVRSVPFLRPGTGRSGAPPNEECRGKGHRPAQITLRSWGLKVSPGCVA